MKKETVSKLKNKLDGLFSKYIRLRDSDEFGFGLCCTCGKRKHYKEVDCGHWISRACLQTRYNEYNAHFQCKNCNGRAGGRQHLHELYILDYHGAKVRDELLEKSKQMIQFKIADYLEMIDMYKALIDNVNKKC